MEVGLGKVLLILFRRLGFILSVVGSCLKVLSREVILFDVVMRFFIVVLVRVFGYVFEGRSCLNC